MATTFEYGYDLAGRLVEVKQEGVVTESYEYDANGNRVQAHTSSQGMVMGSYDDQDRLIEYGENRYTYTANGELLTKTSNGQTTIYHYDVFGNLRQVQLPGKTIEYVIDGRNRRVGKTVNGTLVQGFLYQGSLKPIAELDGNGNVVARFVYGSKGNVPDYLVREGKTYRIISDHLGSPRRVVDLGSGEVAQKLEYDAFGNVVLDTNPGFQPFGFAGGTSDVETGLVRFGARDYDAESGRWTSKDPLKFNGNLYNFYSYVDHDPVNLRDPQGKNAVSVGIRIGAGLGSLAGPEGTVIGAVVGAAIGVGIGIYLNEEVASGGEGTDSVESPVISPKDIIGKTAEEIDKLAKDSGLIPKGPDPMQGSGAYTDPVTGKQRVLIHPKGKPFPHGHVNNPLGERLGSNGSMVPAESEEAHLPICPGK